MSGVSRFECASSSLGLKALLLKTWCRLWICFVAGLVVHLSLTQFRGTDEEHKTAKPLTMKFVKRAPRLTKPLEMKKRPQPKRRQIRREMVSVKARADRGTVGTSIQSLHMAQNLARPRATASRGISFMDGRLEQEVFAEAIESTKDAGNRIDAALEMMDISALDTGKYHAMVIEDLADKRNVRGFFHLARATSRNMHLGYWAYLRPRLAKATVNLVDAMNRYTQIKTKLLNDIALDSNELFRTPWVYVMTAFSLNFTESESRNFGAYLLSGGMTLLDDLLHAPNCAGDLALRELLTAALRTQGLEIHQDWDFEKLPNSHPIYHCFFDFDSPPQGHSNKYFAGTAPGNAVRLTDYLEGVYFGERLVVIMSNEAYANAWGDWGPDAVSTFALSYYGNLDPTRPLQFGVNIIVFALTQEGSITYRLMESVR